MVEEKTEKRPAAAPAAKQPVARKLVRVRILRAIAFEGLYLSPRADGEKVIPIEAIVPEPVAKACSKDRIAILGDAPAGARVGRV